MGRLDNAGHPRGRLGRIDIAASDLGLDADEVRARFAPYVDRFLGPRVDN